MKVVFSLEIEYGVDREEQDLESVLTKVSAAVQRAIFAVLEEHGKKNYILINGRQVSSSTRTRDIRESRMLGDGLL